MAHCKKHAYLDKEVRIMLETKIVRYACKVMLAINLHNNIEQKSLLQSYSSCCKENKLHGKKTNYPSFR